MDADQRSPGLAVHGAVSADAVSVPGRCLRQRAMPECCCLALWLGRMGIMGFARSPPAPACRPLPGSVRATAPGPRASARGGGLPRPRAPRARVAGWPPCARRSRPSQAGQRQQAVLGPALVAAGAAYRRSGVARSCPPHARQPRGAASRSRDGRVTAALSSLHVPPSSWYVHGGRGDRGCDPPRLERGRRAVRRGRTTPALPRHHRWRERATVRADHRRLDAAARPGSATGVRRHRVKHGHRSRPVRFAPCAASLCNLSAKPNRVRSSLRLPFPCSSTMQRSRPPREATLPAAWRAQMAARAVIASSRPSVRYACPQAWGEMPRAVRTRTRPGPARPTRAGRC